MRELSAWSVAASLFFSISLCSSANDVIGTAVSLAGAGNPAAVQRTLSGFVSRMGSGIEMPGAVAPAVGHAVSYSKPQADARLKRGQDWCLSKGKSTTVPADVAGLLGLTNGSDAYPVKARAWQDDNDNSIHGFMSGPQSEAPIVLTYKPADGSYAISWRTDVDGQLLSTVYADASGKRVVPNDTYQANFEGQISYWGNLFPAAAPIATASAGS